jgi:acetyltransferase-like isoleucine patch superfamily enzyme
VPETTIHGRTPESRAFVADVERAWRLVERLNALPAGDQPRIREAFAELTETAVDESLRLVPPFRTEYGRNLRVGRDVFVNHDCTIMDLGGVDIGDEVMIGPNVQIITSGHPLDPETRRSTIVADPIRIEQGAWIAAGATIIGGVTVGRDAVVAAGAVVTKDVPPRTMVAGVPAVVIREL